MIHFLPRLIRAGFCLLCFTPPVLADGDLIVFGACVKQNKPIPIFKHIVGKQPRLFLFLGDNVYADSTNPVEIEAAYRKLASREEFRKLQSNVPILATWDDHDYGANDAGRKFPAREASEQIFHDFFNTPRDHPVRSREGVYRAEIIGEPGRRIQIILLDTRSFRSPLREGPKTVACPVTHYIPNHDPTSTMLGEAQWHWLEEQLKESAEVRIIASSIQVIPDDHCWEKWANLPRERNRLFDLLRKTGAEKIIFISGDRHFADISKLPETFIGYPLYELTSSGLNSAIPEAGEANKYRVVDSFFNRDNAGLIEVDWDAKNTVVTLGIIDAEGQIVMSRSVSLDELEHR